jgi:hypothetical protein
MERACGEKSLPARSVFVSVCVCFCVAREELALAISKCRSLVKGSGKGGCVGWCVAIALINDNVGFSCFSDGYQTNRHDKESFSSRIGSNKQACWGRDGSVDCGGEHWKVDPRHTVRQRAFDRFDKFWAVWTKSSPSLFHSLMILCDRLQTHPSIVGDPMSGSSTEYNNNNNCAISMHI